MYINIQHLDLTGSFPESLQREIGTAKAELNADNKAPLDYEAVMAAKMRFMRQAYNLTGRDVLASPEFLAFFAENEYVV